MTENYSQPELVRQARAAAIAKTEQADGDFEFELNDHKWRIKGNYAITQYGTAPKVRNVHDNRAPDLGIPTEVKILKARLCNDIGDVEIDIPLNLLPANDLSEYEASIAADLDSEDP